MDILKDINDNVSSLVGSSFDEFISMKVTEEIEKGKDKFLNDLNMCEEEYPVYEPSNELSEETFNSLKSIHELEYHSFVNRDHGNHLHNISCRRVKCDKEGIVFDETKFNEEYDINYEIVFNYFKTLTVAPQQIIKDNTFLIHFNKCHGFTEQIQVSERPKTHNLNGYGISSDGVIYQNIRRVDPYYLLKGNRPRNHSSINNGGNQYDKINMIDRAFLNNGNPDMLFKYHQHTLAPGNRQDITRQGGQEIILLENEEYKKEKDRRIDRSNSKYHLYDLSKYIRQSSRPCFADRLCPQGSCCTTKTTPFHEGNGCRGGVIAVKHTKSIEYEDYATEHETTYTIEGDGKEDATRRCLENDICPECRAGELLFSPEEIGFDPRVINKYPLTKEYIDILHSIDPDNLEKIFAIQTIYAKYHPRANENHVIEEKIKKLTNLEEAVNERVSEERERLEKEKTEYSEKIKEINEEKLKKIFSMFIIRNERKNNIDDKNTIKEMIKMTKDNCTKRESELNDKLAKRRRDFAKLQKQKEEERLKEKEEYRQKLSELIVITNDINEINENQEDESCKSDELFEIIKKLKALAK